MIVTHVFDASDTQVVWIANVLLQATIIAVVALSIAAVLQRRPAMKFGVLGTALVLLLLSPFYASSLRWIDADRWALLSIDATQTAPQPDAEPTRVDSTLENDSSIDSEANANPTIQDSDPSQPNREFDSLQFPLNEGSIPGPLVPDDRRDTRPPNPPSAFPDETDVRIALTSESDPVSTATAASTGSTPEKSRAWAQPMRAAVIPVMLIWAVGTLWMLLRMAVGLNRLAAVIRSARPVTTARCSVACRRATRQLGLNQEYAIEESPLLRSPIAVGLMRPRVIVPVGLPNRISTAQLTNVLIHEFAHLLRRDQLINIGQLVAEALFWFHPIVRRLNRSLAQAREEICDNHVLAFTDAKSYGRTLLHIAETIQGPSSIPGTVGFLTANWKLESRVKGLLDQNRNRHTNLTIASRLLLAIIGLGLVSSTIAGTVKLASSHDGTAQSAVGDVDDETGEATSREWDGQVKRLDGAAIESARVYAIQVTYRSDLAEPSVEVLAETLTGTAGEFEMGEFDVPSTVIRGAHQGRHAFSYLYYVATADGYGPAFVRADSMDPGQAINLVMADDESIAGQLIDLDGQPIVGATVRVCSATQAEGPLNVWFEAARDARPPSAVDATAVDSSGRRGDESARFPATVSLPLSGLDFYPLVVTDDNGNFEIAGIGSDRLIEIEFEHSSIASSRARIVTHAGPSVRDVNADARVRDGMIHGNQATITVEPSRTLNGFIRDAETGAPIPNCRLEFTHFDGRWDDLRGAGSAVADIDGHFEMAGLPPLPANTNGYGLRLIPPSDLPYFPTTVTIEASESGQPCELLLKRGKWIEGNVVDNATGQPVPSLVGFLPLFDNESAAEYDNFVAGRRTVRFDDFRPNNEDGSYRVPAIDGPGVLCVVAREMALYQLAENAESIEGIHADAPEVGVYHLFGASMVNHFRFFDLTNVDETPVAEIRLRPLSRHRIKLSDPDGVGLSGCFITGLMPDYPLAPRQHMSLMPPIDTPTPEVVGLDLESPRVIAVYHPELNLGALAIVSMDHFSDNEILEIQLQPCGRLEGTVVDATGEPVPGNSVYGVSVQPVELPTIQYSFRDASFKHFTDSVETDASGRFSLSQRVLPGLEYELRVEGREESIRIEHIEPGERVDLGRIRIDGQDDGPDEQSDETASSPSSVEPLVVQGKIVDSSGDAIPNADVAVTGITMQANPANQFESRFRVLDEVRTDASGEFMLMLENVTTQSFPVLHIAARAEGTAVAWSEINPASANHQIQLELLPESLIQGKLVDLEGEPASGVQLRVESIVVNEGHEFFSGGLSLSRSKHVPDLWPDPIVSNDEGEFIIGGVSAGHGIVVFVEGDEHFATQEIALNTGMSEQRGERDGTYRPTVVNSEPGEVSWIVLSPAVRFEGTIRFEDSRLAAPNAELMIWSSQQDFGGSMIGLQGQATELGTYALNPYPGVRFDITAFPPKDSPYMIRRFGDIRDREGDQPNQIDLDLPRGVLVRGRIVNQETGDPVAGTAVQYVPQRLNNEYIREGVVTGWQAIEISDENGEFTIAVFPGPGTLVAHSMDNRFVIQQRSSREISQGEGGGARNYAHAFFSIDPDPSDEEIDVSIDLLPGKTVRGNVISANGEPVTDAKILSNLYSHPYSLRWRSTTSVSPLRVGDGQFRIDNLSPGVDQVVYFFDDINEEGATVTLNPDSPVHDIQLQPCGSLSARIVDENGDAVAGHHLSVMMVVTPGTDPIASNRSQMDEVQADVDFIQNIDRRNHRTGIVSDDDGQVVVESLIPGATYRILGSRNNSISVEHEFIAKAGERIDVGEVVTSSD